MTAQVPDHITNYFREVDLSNLDLRKVFVGEPSWFNENPYPFKTKPILAPDYLTSACWRGYVAYYSLNYDGTLTLIRYQNLAQIDEFAMETLAGDFWMEMDHRTYNGKLRIPFKNGRIISDKNKWQGHGKVFSYYVKDGAQILDFVRERNILHLMHFTRIENLPSILQKGLVGRDQLDKAGQQYVFNDQLRLDNIPDSNCLSISFPNYKMFYSYRCQEPNTDWAVIRLKPEILWTKECIFCMRNAAEREISQQPIEQKSGVRALQNMFENQHGFPPREVTQIPTNYPTHPQAEVLVRESIDSSFILDILVDRKENIKNSAQFDSIYSENHTKAQFYRDKEYFFGRQDYKHW